jgi:hypothetical protein
MRRPLFKLRRVTLFSLLLVACGSRTGLFGEDDAFTNVTLDGGSDAPLGRRDAGLDREAPPPDALPPIDARPPVDVNRTDCPDADATLVYTITDTYDLQSFDPAAGQFKTIGKIACPAAPGATPFSMAVDRKGVAYVLFNDLHLYRVSTATAACIATPYVPEQASFKLFGMGFATLDPFGPTEALFVAGDGRDDGASGLARITTGTFELTEIGDFFPGIQSAELTGTGDGRLFAYYQKVDDDPDSYIGEIDPQTAQVIGERRFANVEQGMGWAFAYWGGDFYMFHAPRAVGTTVVTRWRPSDDSVTQVATSPVKIVGAGVSTCAPQQ